MAACGTALITGGAKRIGRSLCLELAKKGYDIALHYHASEREAQEVLKEIDTMGRRGEMFSLDLSNPQGTEGLIADVFRQFPDCNLLVNNASIFERGSFRKTDNEFFDRHFDINFKSPFFLAQHFAQRVERGHIINILDTYVEKQWTSYFAYILTKKVLYQFTLMAAKELAPNIRVNGVCPGLILPPPGETQEFLEKMAPRIPLRTHGNPQDIAAAVKFLVENQFVTGECLFIDGGERL